MINGSRVSGPNIAVLADGDILLAGIFTSINGIPRAGLVRLNGAEPQPAFSRIRWLPGSRAILTLQGMPGNRYLIEGSIDLRTWFEVGEVVLPGEPADYSADFEDAQASHFPGLFYRAAKP
jgi:hypothetical protein